MLVLTYCESYVLVQVQKFVRTCTSIRKLECTDTRAHNQPASRFSGVTGCWCTNMYCSLQLSLPFRTYLIQQCWYCNVNTVHWFTLNLSVFLGGLFICSGQIAHRSNKMNINNMLRKMNAKNHIILLCFIQNITYGWKKYRVTVDVITGLARLNPSSSSYKTLTSLIPSKLQESNPSPTHFLFKTVCNI